MKTTILTGALVISVMAASAQADKQPEKKTATVRIKKVENINGVEKVTDTTYTTSDMSVLWMGDGKADVREITTTDGKKCKMVIIDDNTDNANIDLGKEGVIQVTSDEKSDGKPMIKKIVIQDKDGKKHEETIVINSDREMTPEEEKAFREKMDSRMKDAMVMASDLEAADKDGKQVIKIVRIKTIDVSDLSNEDKAHLKKTTGIGDGKLAVEEMKFFPNPSTGKFNLSFNLPDKGETRLNITNMEGRSIYNENLGTFSGHYNKEIDISSYPKGAYFVRIDQGNHAQVKKIVLE